MTRRYYTNAAPQRQLNAGVTSGSTTATVTGTFAGWPTSYPFHAVLEYGSANMEIVLVTGIAGSTATITRGQDNTSAVSHNAGATLDHAAVAKDFDEASNHVNATGAVHGVAGTIVGTTDVQTLTNKTLTAPAISNPNFSGTAAGGLALGGGLTATTVAASGAATAASYAANSNGTVGGVIVPKVYADATARDAALPTPTNGTLVYLTAGSPAGLYSYVGGSWKSVALYSDTGWQTSGLSVSNGTGWTVTYVYRDLNGQRNITFTGTRTGADITASGTGNITDSTVATLNTNPPGGVQSESFVCPASGTGGGASLSTVGDFTITDAHPGSVIANGSSVRATFKYPI